jgi:hypothetical protein
MRSKSRIPLALAMATVLTAITATAALGGNVQRFDSKVTLSANNPFHGRVLSPRHACEVQRTVKVFNKKPGRDGVFGKTTTNGRGKWSIPAMPNGKFYAKVTRREEGAAGTTFVCRSDTSPTRSFGSGGGY